MREGRKRSNSLSKSLASPSTAAAHATLPGGVAYSGDVAPSGEPHGFGVSLTPSGDVYAGLWRSGVKEGHGTALSSGGELIDVDWRRGVAHGDGLYSSDLKSAAHASWINGDRYVSGGSSSSGLLLRATELRRELLGHTVALLQAAPTPGSGPGTPPRSNSTQPVRPTALVIEEPVSNSVREPRPTIEPHRGEPDSAVSTDATEAAMLAAAGPTPADFELRRFLRHFAAFLFPFLAIPHVPRMPLYPVDALEMERRYVVAGAALRFDFETPHWTLYIALVGFVATAVAWVAGLAAREEVLGRTRVSLSDLAVPAAAWTVYAAISAAYQSYLRLPHALERLDRFHFPELARFSAARVDNFAAVTVYTWDEGGENAITTETYPFRWWSWGVGTFVLTALAMPITRVVDGLPFISLESPWEFVANISSMLAVGTFMGASAYVAARILDIQRQVLSRMCVLSQSAFLCGQSIMRPSGEQQGLEPFHLETPIKPRNLREGFVGWYLTRCFVLYASTCSNHGSRAATASVVAFALMAIGATAVGDVLYTAFTDRSVENGADRFTSSHLVALAVYATVGSLHAAYLHVCFCIERERHKHGYIANAAALYHKLKPEPSSARDDASIVRHCRDMVRDHDLRPRVLGFATENVTLELMLLLQIGAVGCLVYRLVQWSIMV